MTSMKNKTRHDREARRKTMNDEGKHGVAGVTDAERILFGGMTEDSPELSNITEKGEAEVEGWENSMQDFFSGSYKYNPKLAESTGENSIARKIMSEVMKTREFSEMRNFTKADSLASSMAAKALAEATLENLPEEVKEKAKEKAETDRLIEELLNDIDPTEVDPESKAKVEELIEKSTELGQEIEDADLGDVRRAARGAAVKAGEEVAEMNEGLAPFGIGTGEGDASKVSASERIELAKRLRNSNKLKEIAELAGRLTRIAMRTRETRVSHGRDEIHDVEQGDDLGRVLPSELLGLAVGGEFETLFLRKFAEKELLQYKVRGTEEKGRGPIVVEIDESGSMHGSREFFAKGIALALLNIAKAEGRDYALVQFGSASEIAVTEFPKGEANPAELMNVIERFFGGGTDFEAPLNKALDIIDRNEFNDADLIFITDGCANLSESFLSRFNAVKAEKDFEVFGIVIGVGVDTVKTFSDRVADWASPEAAKEVFEMTVNDKTKKAKKSGKTL
jgi:uncharacterized protein with von Willebrand factor type A (vWA) domain